MNIPEGKDGLSSALYTKGGPLLYHKKPERFGISTVFTKEEKKLAISLVNPAGFTL